jgi:hypothetical protein
MIGGDIRLLENQNVTVSLPGPYGSLGADLFSAIRCRRQDEISDSGQESKQHPCKSTELHPLK